MRSRYSGLRKVCTISLEGSRVAALQGRARRRRVGTRGRTRWRPAMKTCPNAERSHLGADVPDVRDIVRHLGPLDATLPPTPIRELLAASGATLFVLATDATLVTTIRRAADQHPLFVVETWAELVEAVELGRCGIALLDAAVLGARGSRMPRCTRRVFRPARDARRGRSRGGARLRRLLVERANSPVADQAAGDRRYALADRVGDCPSPAASRGIRERRRAQRRGRGTEQSLEMALGRGRRSECRRVARRRDRRRPARLVGPLR